MSKSRSFVGSLIALALAISPLAIYSANAATAKPVTGGTLNFRNGVTYIIVVCLSGQRTTSYLEVLTTATGWTTKAVGQTYIDKTVCSEIKFPFVLEWSWKVTETAGQATKMRILPWLEEMNVVVS